MKSFYRDSYTIIKKSSCKQWGRHFQRSSWAE